MAVGLRIEWKFKRIKGYENYIVCNDGSFYNKKGKRMILKPSKKKKYPRLRVSVNGEEKYLWANRLVAGHFIGDIEGMEVHHDDRDTWNNNETNLRIVTKRENLDIRNKDNGWKQYT